MPLAYRFCITESAVAASIHLYEMTGHLSPCRDKSDILLRPPYEGQEKAGSNSEYILYMTSHN
jgi:hypothetical protein